MYFKEELTVELIQEITALILIFIFARAVNYPIFVDSKTHSSQLTILPQCLHVLFIDPLFFIQTHEKSLEDACRKSHKKSENFD